MPKVQVLPDYIASQIAAGEVVERPSSVVKELVENSIDAGATDISISVSEGCRTISIADNGHGMLPEDAILAFQRHATSKLASADDLWRLTSLGFRGEALPSIASVAKVTCYTRLKDAPSGFRIDAQEGKITSTETGCAPGTTMEVVDLFYNVPARLKFLKKASTEFAHIQEIVQSLAIAYPHVAISVEHEGTVHMRTSGSNDLKLVVKEAKLFTGNEALIEVNNHDVASGVKVRGLVAKPVHFRGDRKAILTMVNNRPVRCPLTYKALEYAYSDLIPRGRHPFAVIAIEVDPSHVDVNIHPTKKEIKYSQGNEVYLTVQRAIVTAMRSVPRHEIDNALAASQPKPELAAVSLIVESRSAESETFTSPDAQIAYARFEKAGEEVHQEQGSIVAESPARTRQLGFRDRLTFNLPTSQPDVNRGDMRIAGETTFARESAREGSFESDETNEETSYAPLTATQKRRQLPDGWRLLAYLKNTYFLVESEQGLEIIEQHIAHERTIYERLLAVQSEPGRLTELTQNLLISAPLRLSAEQAACLKENQETLSKLGFEFEHTEDGGSCCTQVPLELAHKNYETAIQELLDQLITCDHANIILEATKSVACQSAVKNGMTLSEDSIVSLLCDWIATPRNDTCPHGRPVRMSFSMDKLFQMFHPA
ncbi:MAG: DNA mismatch repair endonuclease MutL [Candidatus Melainabacteria bacterium]|nr:MAG: DNA mismatch repair endonuclease MutL [Candidatus Melainabacteria bacterium]